MAKAVAAFVRDALLVTSVDRESSVWCLQVLWRDCKEGKGIISGPGRSLAPSTGHGSGLRNASKAYSSHINASNILERIGQKLTIRRIQFKK